MNQRVTGILLVALVVSGLATYLVFRAVRARPGAAPQVSTQVIAAAHQIDMGAILADKDLVFVPWTGPIPKGMLTKKDTIIGRGVIATLYEGEPIVETRLAEPGGGGGLAASIPPGMRAVALRVNDIVGVAGFVVPGSRVDILISGMPPGNSSGGSHVKTILQNIQVISAGQNFQKDAEGKPIPVPVVNVLVTPEQAEILSLASNETRIQLVLRNPLDTQQAKPPGTVVSNLYGEAQPRHEPAAPPRPRPPVVIPVVTEAPPPPPPPIRIEVLNGPQRSEASFPNHTEDKKK